MDTKFLLDRLKSLLYKTLLGIFWKICFGVFWRKLKLKFSLTFMKNFTSWLFWMLKWLLQKLHQDNLSVHQFQSIEYVCIDNMKMNNNFYQTTVSATCQTNNEFATPNPWPVCKPSKKQMPLFYRIFLKVKSYNEICWFQLSASFCPPLPAPVVTEWNSSASLIYNGLQFGPKCLLFGSNTILQLIL